MAERIVALVRGEARLLWRGRVVLVAGSLTLMWSVAAAFVPAGSRPAVVAAAVVVDLAALGFFFLPALLLSERTEGTWSVLQTTPVSALSLLGARVGMIGAVSGAATLVLVMAARVPGAGAIVLGAVFTATVFSLVAIVVVGSAQTYPGFMTRLPLIAIPLFVPAMLHHFVDLKSPLFHLTPLTSQIDVLLGKPSWAAVVGQIGWIVVLAPLAARAWRRPGLAPRATSLRVHRAPPSQYSVPRVIAGQLRIDRRLLLRDPLLVMIGLGVPLVAAVIRAFGVWGIPWVRERFGLDLTDHLPVVWAALLVVHTAVMFGSLAGLLVLEDRDAGVLPALAVTRASVVSMLAARLGAAAVMTGVMTGAGLWIAGAHSPAGAVGTVATVVASSALAPVVALAMAATAANRIQGVAMFKLLALPVYLPVVSWYVGGPAAWMLHALPSAWAIEALWAGSAGGALLAAMLAVAVAAVIIVPLAGRAVADPLRAVA